MNYSLETHGEKHSLKYDQTPGTRCAGDGAAECNGDECVLFPIFLPIHSWAAAVYGLTKVMWSSWNAVCQCLEEMGSSQKIRQGLPVLPGNCVAAILCQGAAVPDCSRRCRAYC